MMSMFLILLTVLVVSLGSLPAVSGSGCHGASGFRLAPAHTKAVVAKMKATASSTTKTASSFVEETPIQEMHAMAMASLKQQDSYCEREYGEESRVLDLVELNHEFQSNPADVQHALAPLFEEDPGALYLVTGNGSSDDDGDLYIRASSNENQKLVLVRENEDEADDTFNNIGIVDRNRVRVSGPVFVELRDAASLEQDAVRTSVLCFIPKPKYDPDAMKNSKGAMSGMTMAAPEPMSSSSSSSSSWSLTSSFLGFVALMALGVAAVQTWKARQASANHGNAWMPQPSLDLGGSYSVLSADGDHRNGLLSSATNVEMA